MKCKAVQNLQVQTEILFLLQEPTMHNFYHHMINCEGYMNGKKKQKKEHTWW